MRIIAGEFRSRQLMTPRDGEKTRPMPDRVKESLFGHLRGHFEDATVFDGFSGVGTIGLEALSRGASRVVLVERDREIASILRQNVETLGVVDRTEIFIGDALGAGALARCPRPVHLVFFDPPYPIMREPLGYRRVMDQFSRLVELLDDTGFAVLRTPWPMRHWIPDPNAPVPEEVTPVPSDGRGKRRGKGNEKWSEKGSGVGRSGGKRGGGRGGRQEIWFDEAAPKAEDIEFEDDESGMDAEGAVLADDAGVEPTPLGAGHWQMADLSLANAIGPETHNYHSMAVHLYMRKKG